MTILDRPLADVVVQFRQRFGLEPKLTKTGLES